MYQLLLFEDTHILRNRIINSILSLDFSKAGDDLKEFKKIYPSDSSVEKESSLIDIFSRCMETEDCEYLIKLWTEFEHFTDRLSLRYGYSKEFKRTFFTHICNIMEKNGVVADYISNVPSGLLFIHAGNFVKAVKHLEKALSNKPDDSRVYGYLGDVHFLRGDVSLARICYRNAFETDPHEVDMSFLKDKEIFSLIEDMPEELQVVAQPLDWLAPWGCIKNLFPYKILRDQEIIKSFIHNFHKLEEEYAKDQSRDSVKAKLFYQAMVLSECGARSDQTGKYDVVQMRYIMKEIQPFLFKLYLDTRYG